MNFKSAIAGIGTVAIMATAIAPAIPAAAQSSHHRQQTKNNWRNAAAAAGGLGVLGLLTHNSTLAVAGAAGGLYSLNRYEHDRKSQSHIDHERAAMYRHSTITRNGHRYRRHLVKRDGHRYYTFVRER